MQELATELWPITKDIQNNESKNKKERCQTLKHKWWTEWTNNSIPAAAVHRRDSNDSSRAGLTTLFPPRPELNWFIAETILPQFSGDTGVQDSGGFQLNSAADSGLSRHSGKSGNSVLEKVQWRQRSLPPMPELN